MSGSSFMVSNQRAMASKLTLVKRHQLCRTFMNCSSSKPLRMHLGVVTHISCKVNHLLDVQTQKFDCPQSEG